MSAAARAEAQRKSILNASTPTPTPISTGLQAAMASLYPDDHEAQTGVTLVMMAVPQYSKSHAFFRDTRTSHRTPTLHQCTVRVCGAEPNSLSNHGSRSKAGM